jgi:hypothetical protein
MSAFFMTALRISLMVKKLQTNKKGDATIRMTQTWSRLTGRDETKTKTRRETVRGPWIKADVLLEHNGVNVFTILVGDELVR